MAGSCHVPKGRFVRLRCPLTRLSLPRNSLTGTGPLPRRVGPSRVARRRNGDGIKFVNQVKCPGPDIDQASLFDPDPVSIIALMVGIIGAIPGALAIRDLPRVRRRLTRDKWERTKATINEILDELNHLEVSFRIVQEVLTEEGLTDDYPFELGHQFFLRKAQFKRFHESTDDIYQRGGRIDRAIHRLAELVEQDSTMQSSFEELSRDTAVYNALNRLLHAHDLTIGPATATVEQALDMTRQMVRELKIQFAS